MKPDEVRALPAWCLRLIVLVEARAAPRLRTVEGLWRRSTRTRSGRMTDFIRAEELLPAADIDAIIRDAPADLIRFQDVAAHRSEEHTSELQSLMRISYAVFCLKKKNTQTHTPKTTNNAPKTTSI